jgi:Tol biopolymer transport system component
MDATGRGQRPLARTDVREEAPDCSPDGELIAYQVYDAARRMYDVWVMNADGTNPRALLSNGHSPAWSPSCGRLAFVSGRGGSQDLWVADRNGRGAHRLTTAPEQEIAPAWSPLGDRLAFVRLHYRKDSAGKRVGCTSRVIIRELDGRMGEVIRLDNVELTRVDWSRAEKLILAGTPYGQGTEGRSGLWIVAASGSGLRRLTPPLAKGGPGGVSESQPAWAPDGHWLAFVQQDGEIQAIWRASAEGRERRQLTAGEEGDDAPTFLPRGVSRALRVFIQGRRTYFTPAPYLATREVLLPGRLTCRALGVELRWDPASQSLELVKEPHRVRINLRHRAAKRDGQPVPLNSPPRVISGVTVLPMRYLAELLGIPAQWEPQERVLRLGAEGS